MVGNVRKGLGRTLPRAAALVGATVLGLGGLGGVAWAGGAQTGTFHAHGADAFGLDELDLNPNGANPPPPGIVLPANCWLTQDEGIISTNGNAIMHYTVNKTGDWFTTTYTGDAAVFPLVENDGVPVSDPNTGNNEVDTSAAPLATGHMTQWFGAEDNKQNGVQHATVHFQGTDANGNPVNLQGHFQFATNANGDPTAMVGSISC